MGLAFPLRSSACLSSAAPVMGVSNLGLSTLSFDLVNLESLMLLRCLARSDSPLSVLMQSHIDLTLSLQDYARLGSMVFVFGLARTGFVSVVPVTDAVTLGFAVPVRSFACLESVLSVLDFGSLGSLVLFQGLSHFESSVSICGVARVGSVFALSLIDTCTLGSTLSVRSFACLGSLLLTLDLAHMGSLMLLRSCAHLGSAVLAVGLSRPGLVFALSVVDATSLGFSLPARCLA